MTSVVNINDVLDGHVSLDIACIDRFYFYLNRLRPHGRDGPGVRSGLARAGHL